MRSSNICAIGIPGEETLDSWKVNIYKQNKPQIFQKWLMASNHRYQNPADPKQDK